MLNNSSKIVETHSSPMTKKKSLVEVVDEDLGMENIKFEIGSSGGDFSIDCIGDNENENDTEETSELALNDQTDHPLWPEINSKTNEQLRLARMDNDESHNGWELFAEEGPMKMYKRCDIKELIVEPLKAVHTVQGVSAREFCHYFFDPQYRLEWETTLEASHVLEKISDDILIFQQIHTKVWPAAQRDSVFWSYMKKISLDEGKTNEFEDSWIVCNHSCDHAKAPENSKKFVRALFTATLLCSTSIDCKSDKQITRDNISCRISYCSTINPGGWLPGKLVSVVYKREYPRFLKNFSKYVKDKCKNKPILF